MESHLPLVSIVTPSLNQGRFLRETIRSVLAQDYPALEYWIIDGGSTDETESVLREFSADSRLRWSMEPDRGQSDAINKGWTRASGEIIAWLNSDDTYYPGGVRRQAEALLAHPKAGLVFGDVDYVDEGGRFVGPCHARPFDPIRFLHAPTVPQPSLFFRRALVERHGGLDRQLHYMMDYDLLLRLMRETEFHYTGQRVATYRLHRESKTESRAQPMVDEALQVVARHCERDPDARRHLRAALSDWHWMGAIRALDGGDRRAFSRRFRAAMRLHPMRPRMAMVALRAIDSFSGTRLSERAITLLDRLAARREPTAP